MESEAERAEVMQELCTRSPESSKPVRNEAGMSGQQKRRCPGGGNTFKQCLISKSHSTCQRWSQMRSLTSGRLASHIEIKNAIKKLKNRKATGCDNIPPEAIKVGGDTSEEVLLDLWNRIWSEEKIPEEWKKGLLINLP